jgi:hypothetical protein
MLWVYARDKPEMPFRAAPNRVGGENYLYAPDDGPNPRDDVIEKWLADSVDGPAAGSIKRLLNGQSLNNAQRSAMSTYLAVQDMRTPAARETLLTLFQKHASQWYREYTSDLRQLKLSIWRSEGVWYADEELESLVRAHDVGVSKGVWLDFIIRNVSVAAKRIHEMQWYHAKAPTGLVYVTNDLGITKCETDFPRPISFRIGFYLGATHWVAPLGKSFALALAPREDPRPLKVTSEWVRTINRQAVRDARQFVYASQPSPFVEKIWKIS